MGSLVDTGLGWYLDEDYLRTAANVTIGTVVSGGGGTGAWGVSPNGTLWIADTTGQGDSQYPNAIYLGYFTWYGQSQHVWVQNTSGIPILVAMEKDGDYCQLMAACPTQNKSTVMSNVIVYQSDGNPSHMQHSGDLSGIYTGYSWLDKNGLANRTIHSEYTSYTVSRQANAQAMAAEYIVTDFSGSVTHTITKVHPSAGAFCIVSYPHDGGTVHVGVGISSIGIPNSPATVAVDGTHGSYNTFNREGMQFTMFYTEQLTGTLTANVPTVTLDTDISGLPGVYEPRLFLAVANAASIHVGFAPADEDPYAPGGTSQPSDGTPDFTEVSESISPGSTFPISFQSTGLCRVYVPSITDLNDLANYLWTDQTFLDTIKNILINQFENFMEAVISLTMVPCQVPADTAQPVKVMFLSTGLSFPPATQQFVDVDCGYVDITERYASALDYNPYTKVSLYLPFIGTVPLDTDEVMGHRVKCVYTIDIVSGACVAKIMVDYPDSSNGVLYQFSGHCSISMPLTAADFSSYYAAAMSGLKMAAGLAAAGAGAPGLAGSLLGEPTAHPSSTTTTTRTTGRNAETGRQILTGTESRETSHTPGQASFKELATRASVNTVGAVINSKFSVEHSGGFTGNTGFLGVQAPYVIITRPDMCNPDEYGAYNGRPSMMYLYLGNLSGFTQVQNIKLTGIPATNPELGEISELLKTGVIL